MFENVKIDLGHPLLGLTKAEAQRLLGNRGNKKDTNTKDEDYMNESVSGDCSSDSEIDDTNNKDNDRDIIEKHGRPYYTTDKGVFKGLNESYFAALHNKKYIELYEPDEKSFYRYDENTGIYREVTFDTVKQEISSLMLEMSRQRNVSELEEERNNTTLGNIVSQLKGICERRNAFKKEGKFVHLANGVIVFKDNNEADLVNFSPDFFSRNRSPIKFDEKAKCDRFLNELLYPAVSPSDAVLIQKYVGLCLLGYNLIQRLLILDGLGGRGKTTLAVIMQKLIGLENVTQLRTKFLGERFEIFRFLKKTLLAGVDVPGDFLSEKGAQVIKGLVGGDYFDTEKKGNSNSFSVQGNFNIIITSNSRLHVKLDGDVSAWKRRLLIVRFESPAPKKKIPDFGELLICEEGSGILNWGLQGLAMLFEDIEKYGDIYLDKEQEGIVDALLAESDSLKHFLMDCIEKEDHQDLSVSEIIERYAEYCPEKGWNSKPITVIQKELEGLILELFGASRSQSISRDGKSVRGFRKIKFKNKE